MTITVTEKAALESAVDGFNQVITNLAPTFFYNIVDANSLLEELNMVGLEGLTGDYVLADPATTAFSLDGFHPNNAGHAAIANAFIDILNAPPFSLGITKLNVSQYAGQYLGKPMATKITGSFEGLRALFK